MTTSSKAAFAFGVTCAILITVAVRAAEPATRHAEAAPAHSAGADAKTVLCFGDSITHKGYPKVLGELLKVNTINSGVPGQSTKGAMARFKKDVLERKPDAVVVLFGTNDSRLDAPGTQVTVTQFTANLTEMVKQCRDANIKIVLCTLPPIDEAKYFTRHKKAPFDAAGGLKAVIALYRDATLAVGKEQSVPVVDLNQQLESDPDWRAEDGVHPTDAGNKRIAQLVAEVVEKALELKP